MMRDSGSVKFFWALASGMAFSGSGMLGGVPFDLLPCLSFLALAFLDALSGRLRFRRSLCFSFDFQCGLGLADLLQSIDPSV